jgi:hypothetical protein
MDSIYNNKKELLKAKLSAKISGSALKVTTTTGNGIYPITEKKNGTSIFTRSIFALLKGKPESTIPSEKFLKGIESTLKDSETLKRIKFPKGYKNLKTVSSRLIKEIKRGYIVGFNYSGSPEGLKEVLN